MGEPEDSRPGSFFDVLIRFPSTKEVADGMDVGYDTVASWIRRNFVPANYHARLADLAAFLGVVGVDIDLLRQLGDDAMDQRLIQTKIRRAKKALASSPVRIQPKTSCNQRPNTQR